MMIKLVNENIAKGKWRIFYRVEAWAMTGFFFNYTQTDVATVERASVIVFGDPHMLTYQATKTQTCPALGWQTYLSNEFFQLKAYAEAACTSCEASYVTMVS